MKNFEKFFFLFSIICAFLGITGLGHLIINIILIFAIILYLSIGWYLFLLNKNERKFEIITFIVSFLISQTFVCLLFGINHWPLKNYFSYATILTLMLSIAFLLLKRKSFEEEYKVKIFLNRLIVCLIFSPMPLWI